MTQKTLTFGAMLAAGMLAALPALAASAPETPIRAAVMFWLIDRNGDGAIDQSEAGALRAVVFDAADLNHDGRLTRDEAKTIADAARERVAERVAAVIKDGPAAVAARQEQLAERLGINAPQGLARTDLVDRDSRLFSGADADHNGQVSKSEFQTASGNLRELILPE